MALQPTLEVHLTSLSNYQLTALFSVIILCVVHYASAYFSKSKRLWHGSFLSFAGGVSVAYVFVELLPKLCEGQIVVKQSFLGLMPFLEKHVFVMALLGMLMFYAVEHYNRHSRGLYQSLAPFWLSILAYGTFNFLVGYAVCDEHDPEIRPLALFIFAMSLHMFINDHTLFQNHHSAYVQLGRSIVVSMLGLGYVIGLATQLPAAAIALVVAFMGGGMIMNVFHYELPSGSPKAFVAGAIGYALILLLIG